MNDRFLDTLGHDSPDTLPARLQDLCARPHLATTLLAHAREQPQWLTLPLYLSDGGQAFFRILIHPVTATRRQLTGILYPARMPATADHRAAIVEANEARALRTSHENIEWSRALSEAHERMEVGVMITVLRTDGTLKVEFVNETAAEILGQDLASLYTGAPYPMLADPDDAALHEKRTVQSRVTRPDGRTVTLEVALSHGTYWGRPATFALFQDVTARETALDAVRVSAERLRLVVDHAPLVLMVVDRTEGVTMLRGGGLDALDVEADAALGADIDAITEASPDIGAAVRRAFDGERAHTRATFSGRTYDFTCVPAADAAHGHKVIAIGHDMTERLIASERQAAAEHTAAQERFRNVVLNRLAHELNTPLTILSLSLAPLATESRLVPEQREAAAQRALAASRRLQHVVAQILGALRASGPLVPGTLRETDLDDLARHCIAEQGNKAQDKGIKLARRPHEGDTHAMVSPGLIEEALHHLIQNAIDASASGDVVYVQATTEGDERQIEVLDRGPGPDPQVLEELAGATRSGADKNSVPHTTGLGLGLYIARSVAERHGGTFRLEAREGGGARAVLTLPRDGPEVPPTEDRPPDRTEGRPAAATRPHMTQDIRG